MTNQHPITPPPELVKQWQYEANHNEAMFPQVATQAARWGADIELEACIEWIAGRDWTWTSGQLRAVRRPKPPSLKEQALAELEEILKKPQSPLQSDTETIRRALEQLND